jgi:hypothetical protein
LTRPSVRSLISAAPARIEFIQLEPSGAIVASLMVWALTVVTMQNNINPKTTGMVTDPAGDFLKRRGFMVIPFS